MRLITLLMLVMAGDAAKNVLMLVSDDVGREMKAYGNTAIKMPNMDNLAKKSAVFTSAFTPVSSCSPSRSSILTGLPPHQNGMYGLHHEFHHFNSFDQVQSLPKILSNHGVRTGIIGKKHVAPNAVYPFEFDHSEQAEPMIQVSRNITHIRGLVREFLNCNDSRPFFLYIGFMDAHRCFGKYGDFCEKFGNGEPGMGSIPDWTPTVYDPEKVEVPYFIQDTSAARQDLSNQYASLSRLDQGIGLVLGELKSSGKDQDTIVIYTADNGIPFPSAKTNLYDPGAIEPLLVSSPDHPSSWGTENPVLVSLLDLTPTVLDWMQIPYPHYHIFADEPTKLTGKSLLAYLNTVKREDRPKHSTVGREDRLEQNGICAVSQILLQKEEEVDDEEVIYGSHELHEINMYYPMRSIRTQDYKLIHNLNFLMPYPIALDLYFSLTFQDILKRTQRGDPLPWFKTLKQYYYREKWELYDLHKDPIEIHNVAEEEVYQDVLVRLRNKLSDWQRKTYDPWRCSPGGVLDPSGNKCLPLYNGISNEL